ncbi:MAG: nuclear transport factor 2 family protein [Thermoleophilaceae bacterium]
MSDERIEQARRAILDVAVGEEWLAAVEGDWPPALAGIQMATFEAYRTGDVDWLLDHVSEDVEIVQPPEFPDPRTYRGRQGMLECLLDWPREWERFRVEPRRIFAASDEHILTVAVHRGRARQIDIEVEAEIVWLTQWHDGLLARWDMFMSVDDALETAGSRANLKP